MVCYYAKDSKGTYSIACKQGLNVLCRVESQSFPFAILLYYTLLAALEHRSGQTLKRISTLSKLYATLMPFRFRFPEVKMCNVSSYHIVLVCPCTLSYFLLSLFR